MSSPPWRISSLSDAGIKRRDRPNEDTVGVFRFPFASKPPLLVLADGMGGHVGGAQASQAVAAAFEHAYRTMPAGLPAQRLLTELVQAAQMALKRLSDQDESLAGMGSTVVVALLGADHVGVVNVGDSRAYLCRRGQLRQLSVDHSVAGELLRKGAITPGEAREHPQRSLLTMSLSPRHADVKPYVCEVPVMEGDGLVLCSDGLWSLLSDAELAAVVGELDVEPAARKLIQLANMSQAPDNVSVLVARLGKRLKYSPLQDS